MSSIYPNPSANEFTFEFNNSSKSAQIIIFDCTGRLIEKHDTTNSSFSFGRNYDRGIYLVKIKCGNEVKVFRVVKM